MADCTAKKAKVMDRRARIRHSIQLEVETESEDRLQRVKSQLQHVRSVLHINSRTPMGNLLMMEKLLEAFLESEQRGMASQTPLFSLPSQIPCDKSDNTTKTCDAPYVLASGENTTSVLTFTHPVNRWKTTLLLLMTPYSILWPLWLVTTGIVHCVAFL